MIRLRKGDGGREKLRRCRTSSLHYTHFIAATASLSFRLLHLTNPFLYSQKHASQAIRSSLFVQSLTSNAHRDRLCELD